MFTIVVASTFPALVLFELLGAVEVGKKVEMCVEVSSLLESVSMTL